tara:strand:- start:350 stop:1180 length:831 start_codon:yes stop_codon:yes gene_type:complete
MNKTHTIIIQGGLGNQLFQIFALMGYCIENKCNYIFPKNMQIWDKYRHPYWDSFLCELNKNVKPNKLIDLFIEYIEPNYQYNELPIFTGHTKLNGYFQSDLYFNTHFEKICNILSIREKQSNIKDKYIHYENTISLHFRMGDFVNPHHHPIMSDSYYVNSLNHLIKKTNREEWNVYYACEKEDDNVVLIRINNIKEKLKHLTFIKIPNELEDWEQMLLMSCCSHNIIANSSFSWWSAYLNNNKEKIVCYPSVWFGPAKKSLNLKDLHPEEWVKIQV